jgi:hypothetical protein
MSEPTIKELEEIEAKLWDRLNTKGEKIQRIILRLQALREGMADEWADSYRALKQTKMEQMK